MTTPITLNLRHRLMTVCACLAIIGWPIPPAVHGEQDDALRALNGTWLFVEDRTEGRTVEAGQAPMSAKISLRVEQDAVIYPRPRGDERITLDGSVIEKNEDDDHIVRYHGEWKPQSNWLEYTMERIRQSDNERIFVLKRVFRITDKGLLVYVFSNRTRKQVALYRHPEDIVLPHPAKATIADMQWLAGAWTGARQTSSIEERWSPPKGGAMLGVSRTVRNDRMVGFEYLRIIERDSSLVYIAQPGGRPATEFVLTKLDNQLAVFVNPRHSYPQRIVYALSEEGALTASIGFAKGSLQDYIFQREGD